MLRGMIVKQNKFLKKISKDVDTLTENVDSLTKDVKNVSNRLEKLEAPKNAAPEESLLDMADQVGGVIEYAKHLVL